MDYYRLNNIKADTGMRDSIGQSVGEGGTPPPQSSGPTLPRWKGPLPTGPAAHRC